MSSSRISILIVHGSSLFRELCAEMLCGRGFEVDVAQDGRAALTCLRPGRGPMPDIVLAGTALPDMSGFALLTRFRSLPQAQETPFVFVSCVSDRGLEERAFDAGAEGFVELPVTLEVLEARLRACVRIARRMQALIEQAHEDELTGLLNRRGLLRALEAERNRMARTSAPLAVLLIDLDQFKEVNDTLGHSAGDDVLRQVARTLREGVRPSDVVGRLGGDEFVVVLPRADRDVARHITTRIRARLQTIPSPGAGLQVDASIGMCVSESAETCVRTLLEVADRDMYRGKRNAMRVIHAA